MPLDRDRLKEINKKYSLTDDDPVALFASDIPDDYTYTPTGLLVLDYVIGRPGIPRGRVVELYGPNQSGKTAIALKIAKSAQEHGDDVVYVDTEAALNPRWLGPLDREHLVVVQPENGEQAFDIITDTIKAGAGLVVVDSVAHLRPAVEAEKSYEEQQRALLARLMSKAMRNLALEVSRSQSMLLMINQTRSNMSIYGNPEITPGGSALGFAASLRIRVQKKEAIKDGKEVVGQISKISGIKNKIGAPGREAEFSLNFYGENAGIDDIAATLDAAELCGVLTKRAAYIYLASSGERIASSRAEALQRLRDDPATNETLKQAVWSTLV